MSTRTCLFMCPVYVCTQDCALSVYVCACGVCTCTPRTGLRASGILQLASSGPDPISESDGDQSREGPQPAVTLAEMSLRQKTSPEASSVETVVPNYFS